MLLNFFALTLMFPSHAKQKQEGKMTTLKIVHTVESVATVFLFLSWVAFI